MHVSFDLHLARTVHVRQHGDGFRVTVEPHPFVPDGAQGYDRRFQSIDRARVEGHSLSGGYGWSLQDHTVGVSSPREPGRSTGRPRAALYDRPAGGFVVRVEPRPWGWQHGSREFVSLATAQRYLEEVRKELDRMAAKDRRLFNRR